MRVLYIFFVFNLANIQTPIIAMHLTACAPEQTAPSSFGPALICVAREAELKRTSEKEKEAKRTACTKVTQIPAPLIVLGDAHAAGIKTVFDGMTVSIKGISDLVVEYV